MLLVSMVGAKLSSTVTVNGLVANPPPVEVATTVPAIEAGACNSALALKFTLINNLPVLGWMSSTELG